MIIKFKPISYPNDEMGYISDHKIINDSIKVEYESPEEEKFELLEFSLSSLVMCKSLHVSFGADGLNEDNKWHDGHLIIDHKECRIVDLYFENGYEDLLDAEYEYNEDELVNDLMWQLYTAYIEKKEFEVKVKIKL